MLEVKGVSKAFGGVQALNRVDLSIRRGEVHCLAGGNGSGKSTLIKIISGFYRPDEGTVTIDGETFSRLTPMESILKGVQVIYQDLSVFPNLTVAENIALNSELLGKRRLVDWRGVNEIAARAMEKIGVRLDKNALVETLSVADKQLVAIARAIVNDAKLIIMDEPTTALTRREIDHLFSVIGSLRDKGVSILFVSHKLDEIFEIAERFTIFRNGEMIVTDEVANVDSEKFVFYMTGRRIDEELFIPEKVDTGRAIFQVENIAVKNGFADVSFSVHPGEILGITGLLGSGRTELAKALFGFYPLSSGSVYIDGRRVDIKSPMSALKNGIGYVPEDRLTEGLCLVQSAERNLVVSSIDRLVKKHMVDEEKIHQDFAFWQKELSIKLSDPQAPINTLSGGNQQKVVLAKWLETRPKVLILNGPTVGVDVGAKYDLHSYLRRIVKDGSIAVIIISDDIGEVVNNCNRILVMKKGRIVEELRNTETNEHDLLDRITASA